MSKKIIDLSSGSITDSGQVYIGDPITGALTRISYKQVKDYATTGVSSYDPTSLNASSGSHNLFSASILSFTGSISSFTASILSFTSSYITDSASFNTRINAAGTRVDNSTLILTNNSSSLNLSSSNSWAANIILQPTYSVAVGFTGIPTASLEAYKHINISNADVMIARFTGENSLGGGNRNTYIKLGVGPLGINAHYDIVNMGNGNLEFRYGNAYDTLNTVTALPLLLAYNQGIMVGRNSSTVVASKLGIGAGSTTLSQINLSSGSAPTSPLDGDIWYDTTGSIKFRASGSLKAFQLDPYNPANLNAYTASAITDSASVYTKQFNYDPAPAMMAAMGSTIKGYPLGSPVPGNNSSGLTANQINMISTYLSVPTLLTGLKYSIAQTGNYTASGFNQVALYSVSNSILILQASSSATGNPWTGSLAVQSSSFVATYQAPPGVYYAAFTYQTSNQQTQPKLNTINQTSAYNLMDFTGNYRLACFIGTTNTFPATISLSTTGNGGSGFWLAPY